MIQVFGDQENWLKRPFCVECEFYFAGVTLILNRPDWIDRKPTCIFLFESGSKNSSTLQEKSSKKISGSNQARCHQATQAQQTTTFSVSGTTRRSEEPQELSSIELEDFLFNFFFDIFSHTAAHSTDVKCLRNFNLRCQSCSGRSSCQTSPARAESFT